MKVLVACEFSGIVRDAFAALGHDAWSCDLLPTERPGKHLQGDVLDAIHGDWDLMIAHPPCTHLAVSGAKHWAKKRADGRQKQGIDFFMALTRSSIPKWCIENPIGIMSKVYRKPDQTIHPFFFGNEVQKATCLWLKNLPPLLHAEEDELFLQKTHVGRGMIYVDPRGHSHGGEHTLRAKRAYSPLMVRATSEDRWKIRSRTFEGVAKAMAAQWT